MQSTDCVNGRHESPCSALPPGMQDEAASGIPDSEPIGPILRQLMELSRALREYAMTWTDQARIAVQIGLYKAAIALVVGLAGLATLVISTSLLLIGASTGIGLLCGGHVWIGQMIVGGAVFAITFASLAAWRSSQSKANWRDLLRRYEQDTRSPRQHHADSTASAPQ